MIITPEQAALKARHQFDALRDFRMTYTNQGPEQLGTGPE